MVLYIPQIEDSTLYISNGIIGSIITSDLLALLLESHPRSKVHTSHTRRTDIVHIEGN